MRHFETYMMMINKILLSKTGLTADCIGDWDWHVAFEEQTEPCEAVEYFLEDMNYGVWVEDSIEALYGEYSF